MAGEKVQGYCPMGCGETLMLGNGGHVTCSWLRCPEPTAVDQIIGDSETEHIVKLDELGFAVQHPLRERLGGELFSCTLHEDLRALDGPPREPGRYRATPHHPDAVSESYRSPGSLNGWDLERLEEARGR